MSSRERHPILDERAALCDLMTELGPHAPTWCGDWTTVDLAAHLVVRETRPDAGPGLLIGGWPARHTERVRTSAVEGRSYEDLVAKLRGGPPRLWPGSLRPEFDVHEWFVHHEDVRRPNGMGERVDLGPLEPAVWSSLRRWGPMLTRPLDVGVVLRTPEARSQKVRDGEVTVTLTASPGALMLRLFGRPVEVEAHGDAEAVRRFETAELGI